MIAWHMLSKGEDCAFARPSLVREKIRRLELLTGTGRSRGERGLGPDLREQEAARLELGSPAKPSAHTRAPRPRLATRDEEGAGAAPGPRISWAVERPSSAAGDSPSSCALARGRPHHHNDRKGGNERQPLGFHP